MSSIEVGRQDPLWVGFFSNIATLAILLVVVVIVAILLYSYLRRHACNDWFMMLFSTHAIFALLLIFPFVQSSRLAPGEPPSEFVDVDRPWQLILSFAISSFVLVSVCTAIFSLFDHLNPHLVNSSILTVSRAVFFIICLLIPIVDVLHERQTQEESEHCMDDACKWSIYRKDAVLGVHLLTWLICVTVVLLSSNINTLHALPAMIQKWSEREKRKMQETAEQNRVSASEAAYLQQFAAEQHRADFLRKTKEEEKGGEPTTQPNAPRKKNEVARSASNRSTNEKGTRQIGFNVEGNVPLLESTFPVTATESKEKPPIRAEYFTPLHDSMKRTPSNRSTKEKYPLKEEYFTPEPLPIKRNPSNKSTSTKPNEPLKTVLGFNMAGPSAPSPEEIPLIPLGFSSSKEPIQKKRSGEIGFSMPSTSEGSSSRTDPQIGFPSSSPPPVYKTTVTRRESHLGITTTKPQVARRSSQQIGFMNPVPENSVPSPVPIGFQMPGPSTSRDSQKLVVSNMPDPTRKEFSIQPRTRDIRSVSPNSFRDTRSCGATPCQLLNANVMKRRISDCPPKSIHLMTFDELFRDQ